MHVDTVRPRTRPDRPLVPAAPRPMSPTASPDATNLSARPWSPPSAEATIAQLEGLERRLAARGDRRAVFVTSYLLMTRRAVQAIRTPGTFEDPAFMDRLTRRFAQYFFDAFDAYERGGRVPPAWLLAFDRAKGGGDLVLEDLMLGISAHILNDLPQATADVQATEANARDYFAFNQVLFEAIDPAQVAVIGAYNRPLLGIKALGAADTLLCRADEAAAGKILEVARKEAWDNSRRLAAGEPGARADLEAGALKVARGIELLRLLPFHRFFGRHAFA